MNIMHNLKGLIIALLCLVHLRTIFTGSVPNENTPIDSFAISCGSSNRMIAADGRAWLEDVGSAASSFHTLSGKSMMTSALHRDATVVDPTPYDKARISHHEFTYTFHVPPGQKFIRLHFSTAAYKGFQNSVPKFSVKAGKFTLLTNFSPALHPEKIIVKEFCVNIKENQALDIVFSPFVQAKSKDVYSFINGIEIVSMPAGLYFTGDSDLGAEVVGQKYKFYIDNATALELVKRLNIGGNSIPSVEDESMFRGWDSDFDSFTHTDSVSITRNVKIQYKAGPSSSYIAPMRVYQSAKTTKLEKQLNKHNLIWKISVDSGFRYLIRLHFCELEPEMMKDGDRKFSIFINNEIAESNADIIKWAGGQGVALYRDFVVILEGNPNRAEYNLLITLEPKSMSNDKQTDAILNGLEIFKMSNLDNHLASRSDMHHTQSPTSSWFPKQMRLPSFGKRNAIATMLTVIITSLNIVVYYLRRLSERNSDVRNMSSQCHQFSLDEIRSTTNNFHQEYLIGSGGYGKVYKGRVNRNEDILVAIKRLKPESRHGENAFWTEIEMLTKLQHENLVPLVGFCNENQEFILVYQYMNRGTLDDHLYKIARKRIFHPPLSWDQRLKIAISAASGLCYLHEKQVIHRDVKSSNILIDENWVAKISDFGLSRMGPEDESLISHVSSDVKGTFGYFCPEYFQTRMLSFKSDVYAFGVVLLEVLTGRPPVDMTLPDEQYNLAAWAQKSIRTGNVDGIIDPTLLRQIAPACLKRYVEVAQSCLKTVPRERPSMFDVVRYLESALLSQQKPDPEDVIEVDDGSTSFADTASLITDTLTSITEDDISTESMGQGSDIARSAKHGLKERDSSSNVPLKKWWNLFRYFQKPPKSRNEYGNLSFNEILVATDNFSNSLDINYGGSVTVCKGKTDGGQSVVVIRSYMEEETNSTVQELQTILGMSPSGNHMPPASLIGYCVYKPNRILIFNDIDVANRTLHKQLHTPVTEPLSWKQRLMICIDAARISRCLHAVKTQFWDLTSADILLDEKFAAKIDLYSAASRISTNNRHQYWGLDSHYIRDEKTNEKSAVFSFGIILFEVLCAGEASRDWFGMDPITVAQWIMPRTNGNFIRHFDPYLVGKISPESSNIYLEIASRCLHRVGRERPTMSEIVSQLEMALQLQDTNNEH